MRSSAQELFVFPEIALLAEPDLRKLNCEVPPAAQHLEMLSPGVFKNSWFSLMLIVRHAAGQRFVLDGGQNPANTFELQLRRMVPGPDSILLEDVAMPFQGRIAEGQRCAVFVLDAWVKPGEQPERVKLEPAIWAPKAGTEGFWQRYPMEVRVLSEQLPEPAAAGGILQRYAAGTGAGACVFGCERVPGQELELSGGDAAAAGEFAAAEFEARSCGAGGFEGLQ